MVLVNGVAGSRLTLLGPNGRKDFVDSDFCVVEKTFYSALLNSLINAEISN